MVVVAPDALMGELLTCFLEEAGAAATVFEYPEDFLKAMADPPRWPDLIVLDLAPPIKAHLVPLLRKLRARLPLRYVPCLALADQDLLGDGFDVLEEGIIDEYISKPISRAEFRLRLRALLRLKELRDRLEEVDNVLQTMVTMVEAKDVYTKGHSLRVAELAANVGKRLGLSGEEVEVLYRAGLLHDIGKIIIDTSCLNKPGPLTPEERQEIKRHPETGALILSQMERTKVLVPLVRDHHERLDGSGYPAGKKGAEIHFYVRILSVADVYDALTSDRVYRRALSREKALEVIGEEVARGWWDPEAFRLLVRVVTGPGA